MKLKNHDKNNSSMNHERQHYVIYSSHWPGIRTDLIKESLAYEIKEIQFN